MVFIVLKPARTNNASILSAISHLHHIKYAKNMDANKSIGTKRL